MEPHKNMKRTHGGSFPGDDGDRLSALPEGLLHEIMSRMPARQMVQTCALSRRWRHLWRSAPCVDLDRKELFKPSSGFPTQAELDPPQDQLDRFQRFGDSLLLNREAGSRLGTLSLHLLDTYASRLDPGRWMRYAFTHCNLKELRYENFGERVDIKMPLDLGPNNILTWLYLRNVSVDERLAEAVASVFVALEVLELEKCAICCRSVTSKSLRSLVIDGGYNIKGHEQLLLVVTAPRLTSLRIHDWSTFIRVSVNEVLSLEKASMLIAYPILEKSFQRYQLKLLSTLCNVTSLELSGFLEKMLPDVKPVEFPTFINLRTLLLFHCMFFQERNYCGFCDNFQLLGPLLQNSPNLEKVTMRSRQLPIFTEIPKYAELVYNDGDEIQELVHFLLGVSDRVPKNILALHQSSMSK